MRIAGVEGVTQSPYLAPEARARIEIDAILGAAGWVVQDYARANISAARGVAVREGGAGETVRRKLLATCDVHTLLRLPTGVFYAQGVKANVLFFDRRPAAETPWTREVWVYDLRTNMHFTLKQNPLHDEHLRDFVAAYCPGDRGARAESERFRRFAYDDLVQRDKASLDLIWLRDESLEEWRTCRRPT